MTLTQPTLPDTLPDRLYLAMLIARLESTLLAASSATRALEDWMAQAPTTCLPPHPAPLRVERLNEPAPPCPPTFAPLLENTPEQQGLHYRKIRMTCGGLVLSEAENWYRPDLLDADMLEALEHTDTPFGRAVHALQFFRQTLARESLWWPLPETLPLARLGTLLAEADSKTSPQRAAGALEPISLPTYLFRHTALLRTRAGRPFSLVAETYTAQTLWPFLG